MQGDEAIAVPATPPVAPLRPALAGRRPSSSWRGRLARFWADVRAEAVQFRRLFRYSRPYRVMLVASWIATAGYAAAGAGIVHMVQPIFDDVLIKSVNVGTVALTMLALYAVKGLCSFLSTTMVAAAGQRAVTDLRNDLYRHVLNQSFTFLSRHSTGSLMSHVTTDVWRATC
ncbi:MAG: hypothetical protein DMF82_04185 [Acidobacteria bacterium]|nr:MAG: hypothetical protein DMF82_04185 [Acidobacteriota bacterium]